MTKPLTGRDLNVTTGGADAAQNTPVPPRHATRLPRSPRMVQQTPIQVSATASSSSAQPVPEKRQVAAAEAREIFAKLRPILEAGAWSQLPDLLDRVEHQGINFSASLSSEDKDMQRLLSSTISKLMNDSGDSMQDAIAELMLRLLRVGFDPEAKDATGNTLLMKACKAGRVDVVTTLLQEFPALKRNQLNREGKNAAMLAHDYDNVQLLPLLQQYGVTLQPANPALDFYRQHAGILAGPDGIEYREELRKLLRSDHFMHLPDAQGRTLLFHAVQDGNLKVVSLLCNFSDPPELIKRDHHGKTVFDYASAIADASARTGTQEELRSLYKRHHGFTT